MIPQQKPTIRDPYGISMNSAAVPTATPPARVEFWMCTWMVTEGEGLKLRPNCYICPTSGDNAASQQLGLKLQQFVLGTWFSVCFTWVVRIKANVFTMSTLPFFSKRLEMAYAVRTVEAKDR